MASHEMVRILVSDHLERPVGDIDATQVAELTEVAQVNGEHSLTIVTTQELAKTDRLLVRDSQGYWHEYVVLGIVSEHGEGGTLWHEYYCVWSLQYDLEATFIDNQYGCGVRPGKSSVPQTARRGLECALEGTSRWAIGTISVTAMASASFYRRSGWEGLQTVVEKWGGELRATITVDSHGVASRAVDLLEHEGRSAAVRRFDYGFDLDGIKKTVSDDVWPCRIVPLGASQETEDGGYTRRPSIESVNDGIMWLQDDDAVPLTRIPDGSGGWEYPTLVVKNDTYEEPADLLAWAREHITDYTRPKVSYEASVAQFTRAGMDAHGVALGDEVVVVDRTFGTEGLRLEARVLKIKQNLLDPAGTELTIGNLAPSLGGDLAALGRQVDAVEESAASAWQYGGSTEWVQNLLGRINGEANATGGYTYITQGQGIRAYDTPVSDPLVGAEASMVVEVKGGTIRIANTKDAQGQWEWKTVFVSGHVLSELIEAIGSESGAHAQLTPYGLAVYDGAALLSEFAGDHASILPDWADAGRTVGDIGYISIVGDSGRIETEIGPTRDIMRIRAFGPLYLQGYDGVYATSDNGGLQTSVNLASLVSTDWADLPLASGVRAYTAGGTPRYREVMGAIVVVSGTVTPLAQVAAGGSIDIGTLPEGFRPARDITMLCQGSGNAVWLLYVGANGVLTCSRYRDGATSAAIASGAWLTFHCMFSH